MRSANRLVALLVIITVLWCGYWFIGSTALKNTYESWFDARRAEGWQAEYTGLAVKGFPNRFDTTLKSPGLADPHSGLAWSAPFLQIFALTYKPNHIIAVFPNTQNLAMPSGKLSLASADMRASMVMEPQTDLAFNRANLTAEALIIRNEASRETRLDGLQAALRRTAPEAPEYRLAVNADGLAPPRPDTLPFADDLPDTLTTLRADASLTFSKPWDITALEDGRPQPRAIELHLAEVEWGRLKLAAAGTLEVDRAGIPTGEITLKARNWRDILTLAKATGQLPESLAARIEQGLSLLAGLSGNSETLDITLRFAGGLIHIGPVPLARSPRLLLR